MKKERKEDSFIRKPFFKGGAKAMNAFIQSQLRYPADVTIPVEGTVIVRYDIDHQGNVTDARVIKSLGSSFDEEALRVVRMLHFEVPKTPRKLKVLFHKDIQIHFKPHALPAVTPPPPQTSSTQITYQIVQNNKPAEKKQAGQAVIQYILTIKKA